MDLALTIWDALNGGTRQLLSRPEHNPPPRTVRITRYQNGTPISSNTQETNEIDLTKHHMETSSPSTHEQQPHNTDIYTKPSPDHISQEQEVVEHDESEAEQQDLTDHSVGNDPPPDQTEQNIDIPPLPSSDSDFDPTNYLATLLGDMALNKLNTVSTDLPEGQIRICSLNVNGLSDVKLGLLLTYMELMKIDVLALQDTRLTITESNRMGADIRT